MLYYSILTVACKFPTIRSKNKTREGGGRLNFRKDLMLAGAGGPDALQTSSQGEEHGPISNFRFLRDAVGAEADIRASARV